MAEDTLGTSLWLLIGSELAINSIDLVSLHVNKSLVVKDKNTEEFGMSSVLQGNTLWLGSSTGLRTCDLQSGKFVNITDQTLRDSVHDNHTLEVSCLFKDSHGSVWSFHSGYGLSIYNTKTKKLFKHFPLSDFNDHLHTGKIVFNKCIAISPGNLIAATSQGLRVISFDSFYNLRIDNAPCTCLPDINTEEISAVCTNSKGDLFIASHSELYCFNLALDRYTLIKETDPGIDGDWLSSIQYIYCDNEDNIWLGCQQGLAFMSGKPSPFRSLYFDAHTNQRLDHVRSICVPPAGNVLVGLRNGLASIDAHTGAFSITDKDHLYHHIFADHAGKIHVARPDGMFLFNSGTLLPVDTYYPELLPFAKNPVNSHIFLGDSVIILGTENDKGILVWNYKTHTAAHLDEFTSPRLASGVVNNIYADKRGRIWVLSDHIATILSDGLKTATPLTIRDSKANRIVDLLFDMCEAAGDYWLVAYGTGLVQLDSSLRVTNVYNTRSGLSDDGVYQVFPVGNKLAITTDNGLSVFDVATRSFKNYFEADGLHSSSFEEVAGTVANNLIYAGGVKGFTIIDPSKFSVNTTPPKVYLNRVFIDRSDKQQDIDTTNLEMHELQVPNDVLQVSVYFSGINYSNPARTTFAYRLLNKNAEWVDMGTQNYINLIGLSPGTYRLQVRAANEDGYWSPPVELSLVYLPKWYQTLWFKGLLILLGIGIGYTIYRVRIYQIMRQQAIRREVASDLHDDIGSSLNSVKVFAHLAKADPKPHEYIRSMEENLEHATVGLRDMIWVLDDKLDSVTDLANRLDNTSAKTARAAGIDVEFVIEDPVRDEKLAKTWKRNLFLVAKEAINNSVKYAGCQTIKVAFAKRSGKIIITITDDGKGFDVSSLSAGYGLTNMTTRADQIGFACNIASGPSGTEIRLVQK